MKTSETQLTLGKKKPSLIQVAELAKVSPVTVARTFTGTAPVAEKTRLCVEAAARALGYSPNLLARGLRGGRTQTIGLLWSLGGPPAAVQMTRNLTIRVQRRGYVPSVMDNTFDETEIAKNLEDYSHRGIDGVVVELGPPVPKDKKHISSLLKKFRAAVVITPSYQGLGVDEIVQDRLGAISEAAEHFANTGRNYPAIIMPLNSAKEKVDAFVQTLEKKGIPLSNVSLIDCPWGVSQVFTQTYYDVLEERFPKGTKRLPDCFFCGADEGAIAAIAWAKSRGLRVPQDIAIVGFNDNDGLKFMDPPIASISRRNYDVADDIEEMLFSRLEEPESPVRTKQISMEFIWRESAG
jgi:LacI family transcriptional regulator